MGPNIYAAQQEEIHFQHVFAGLEAEEPGFEAFIVAAAHLPNSCTLLSTTGVTKNVLEYPHI